MGNQYFKKFKKLYEKYGDRLDLGVPFYGDYRKDIIKNGHIKRL